MPTAARGTLKERTWGGQGAGRPPLDAGLGPKRPSRVISRPRRVALPEVESPSSRHSGGTERKAQRILRWRLGSRRDFGRGEAGVQPRGLGHWSAPSRPGARRPNMEAGSGVRGGNGPKALLLRLGPSRARGVRHQPTSRIRPQPFSFIIHRSILPPHSAGPDEDPSPLPCPSFSLSAQAPAQFPFTPGVPFSLATSHV